jgi:hypothetical protein
MVSKNSSIDFHVMITMMEGDRQRAADKRRQPIGMPKRRCGLPSPDPPAALARESKWGRVDVVTRAPQMCENNSGHNPATMLVIDKIGDVKDTDLRAHFLVDGTPPDLFL